MTDSSRCSLAVVLGFGLFATSAFAQNATIAIKAVKLNPTCIGGLRDALPCVLAPDCPGGVCGGDITPTDTLTVHPLDVIVVDVLALDYSPAGERLIAYQFETQNSFAGSLGGGVSLLEFPRGCETASDCAFVDRFAVCLDHTCVASFPLDPHAGSADIDSRRFDFVFFTRSSFVVVDLSTFGARFLGALSQRSDSRVYPGSPRYLGTVAYLVGPEMRGTAEIHVEPVPGSVLLERDGSFILPLDLPPLTLTRAPDPICGDDSVNQATEICDGTDDSACPGRCLADCTCAPAPVCGDSSVNQASEVCDGADDSACPGLCQTDCTCPPAPVPTVSQWGLAALVLLLLIGGKVGFGRQLRPRNSR